MDSESGIEIPSSLWVNENPLRCDSDRPTPFFDYSRGLVDILFVGDNCISVLTPNTVAGEAEGSPAESRGTQ